MSQTPPSVRRNLRACSLDGGAFGAMVGLGETFLAPFALAMGMGEVSAGLVASLPMLAGGTLQLISLRAIHWVGSERRWILLGATVQALAFLPLVYAGLSGTISPGALILIASIYWGAGLATGPAWNTWIETMVPAVVRHRYFAVRSRLAQLTTLGGFLLGGLVLTVSGQMDWERQGYAALFALALLFRLVSVYWLAQHRELVPRGRALGESGRHAVPSAETPKSQGRSLLIFLVVFQGMVHLSAPFFTPFMLTELGFTYVQFVALIAMSFIAKILSLSTWGHYAKRRNAKSLLWIGAIGIVPMSGAWIVSQNYVYLAVVQTLGGVTWAAYELGFFLMFFEALPKERRRRMLTIYNFTNTLAIFTGATLGAWVLRSDGATRDGYLLLFGLSSAGRLLALGILASTSLVSVPIVRIGVRVLGVRPGGGMVDAPVLPSFNGAESDVAEQALVER